MEKDNKELIADIKENMQDLNIITQSLTGSLKRDYNLIAMYIFKESILEHYMGNYIKIATEELTKMRDEKNEEKYNN